MQMRCEMPTLLVRIPLAVLNDRIALPTIVHHLLFKIKDGATIRRQLESHTGFLDLPDM